MLLSTKNKHILDKRIKFQDEGHIYWIDNDNIDIISCTKLIHSFSKEFNADKIISFICKSFNYKKNPDYKYYQIPQEDIKNMWIKDGKDASDAGTKLHADIEMFYNSKHVNNTSPEYLQFLDFYRDHSHLKIYRTEWCIFLDTVKITGSIDAVFENSDGTLSIYDWKRSKEIKRAGYRGEHLKYPFEHLPDCNYSHYSLQLNLYREILEKIYGKTIKDMCIVVFHPDNKDCEYIKIYVPRMDDEMKNLMKCRIRELISIGYDFGYESNEYDHEFVIDSEDSEEEPKHILR
jgi:uncharacterized protein (UPF0332 family)